MDKQQWHVLGAGSIGCLWAASLCDRGFATELIVRAERLQTLKANPVTIRLRQHGQVQPFPVSVTSPEAIRQPVHRLIVCTKAQDALSAIDQIAHWLTRQSQILLLQNGMGSQQAIIEKYPELNIWAGSVTDGAYLNGAFDVCHAGQGETMVGPLTPYGKHDDFAELAEGFRLNVQRVPDIEQQLWSKLAINCCINGLTALFNCHNGELLENSVYRSRLMQLVEETVVVMEGLGIAMDDLSVRVQHICRITAENVSSTCLDARMNRTTELTYINGFLIRQAGAAELPIKAHRRLMSELEKLGIN